MSFSALILAGGRSSRMGRDKARLTLDGETLVARQVRRAREAGAVEVWISGRAGVDYGPLDAPVLLDDTPDTGPLAGIARGLAVMQTSLLLVLAVDMPRVADAWLARGRGLSETGLIARLPTGLEPLAAWYPGAAAGLLDAQLARGRRAARGFAEATVEAGLTRVVDLDGDQVAGFKSWNEPDDLPRY